MSVIEHPAIMGMARRADLKRTADFQAVLLGMVGHDLRQPLQAIQGVKDRLAVGARTKSEQQLLQMGQDAINRLTGQLDQLLSVLRLYEYRRSLTLSSVDLESIFWKVCFENQKYALQKGIEIRVCSTRLSVMSDAVLLTGILRNLVSNAIKYTEPKGRVLIGCRRSDKYVRIDVCDTGMGITQEQLPRIFEAFNRIDYTRCDGLGMGLFIVRRATELLGHSIDVSSVDSRGSRFSILAMRVN